MKARRSRQRTTLAEGIYLDASGVSVIARIGTRPNILEDKARFGLVDDDGIPYSKKNCSELIKCRLQLLEDLRVKRARDGGESGSLGDAIDKWKHAFPIPDGVTSGKRYDDHGNLAAWRACPLASVQVEDLKRSQVRAQLLHWHEQEDFAPSTVNHRKQGLTMVLRWQLGADDDSDVRIVTDGIENIPDRPAEARGYPMPILARIINTMSNHGRAIAGGQRPDYSENKIRLRVMAWTGLAHKSLERLERRRVNFREGKLFYPDRRKGKGSAGIWVDLLPPALDALKDFDRAALWGKTFSRSSMRKAFRLAVTKTRKQLVADAETTGDRTMLDQFIAAIPDNPKPYDARHSFLSDAWAESGDLGAVAEIGQHKSLKTTERYTRSAVPVRVSAAIEKQRAKWFPDAKPAATVRDFHVVSK